MYLVFVLLVVLRHRCCIVALQKLHRVDREREDFPLASKIRLVIRMRFLTRLVLIISPLLLVHKGGVLSYILGYLGTVIILLLLKTELLHVLLARIAVLLLGVHALLLHKLMIHTLLILLVTQKSLAIRATIWV